VNRWELVLVFVLLFVWGVTMVEWLKSVEGSTRNVTATIIDAVPASKGLILTVNANGKLYRVYTNTTMINVSAPVILQFENGKLVRVLQEGRVIGVLEYKELKTLEKIPTVKRGGASY